MILMSGILGCRGGDYPVPPVCRDHTRAAAWYSDLPTDVPGFWVASSPAIWECDEANALVTFQTTQHAGNDAVLDEPFPSNGHRMMEGPESAFWGDAQASLTFLALPMSWTPGEDDSDAFVTRSATLVPCAGVPAPPWIVPGATKGDSFSLRHIGDADLHDLAEPDDQCESYRVHVDITWFLHAE
jgi:hypothetical protein